MPGDVAAVRAKVQQYLTQNVGNISIDRDGDYSVQHGSARIFVRVWTRDEPGFDFTVVRLWVELLSGVKETASVFEHIALHSADFIFGSLYARRTEDGLSILLTHSLLGDYLDEDELMRAFGGMLVSADELDDELRAQFGGERFHED